MPAFPANQLIQEPSSCACTMLGHRISGVKGLRPFSSLPHLPILRQRRYEMVICMNCRRNLEKESHELGCRVTRVGWSDEAYARLLDAVRMAD